MNREVRALSSSLATFVIKPNQDTYATRQAAAKVLELMNRGVDLIHLAGNMVKLLASPDLVLKKVSCIYLARYADKIQELNLLAANTLQKDLIDPNPLIRGLALKTMFSVPCLMDQGVNKLRTALEDRNPYVRRIAVVCCSKLHRKSPHYMKEMDFVDVLYSMIRDPDAVVIVNCLCVLDDILSTEGGIVINHNIAHYLLSQLPIFRDWELVSVFKYIKKYQPGTEEETLDFLNVLDDYLKDNNAAVVEATVHLFLSLLQNNFPMLVRDVLNSTAGRIQNFLTSPFLEVSFAAVEFLEEFVFTNPCVFQSMYKSFFCKFSDPITVKVKKLAMIPYLCSDENIQEIVEELHYLCTDTCKEVSHAAIHAVVKLCSLVPASVEQNFTFFRELVKLESDAITTEVLSCVANSGLPSDGAFLDGIVGLLSDTSCFQCLITSQEGKRALLCLLGEYGDTVKDSPYILEDHIDNLDTKKDSTEFKLSLLTTSFKIFLARPPEMQEALGRLFCILVEDTNPVIKYQTQFYHSLLEIDIKMAQVVVLGKEVQWTNEDNDFVLDMQ